jgi:hypothetical protein
VIESELGKGTQVMLYLPVAAGGEYEWVPSTKKYSDNKVIMY